MHYEPARSFATGRPLKSQPGSCTWDVASLLPHMPICLLDSQGRPAPMPRKAVEPHTGAKGCPCWAESDKARKERRQQERKERQGELL